MTFDLATALAHLTPKAIEWAEQRALEILATGQPLSGHELTLARQVGVAHPGRIRLSFVEQLPQPTDAMLRQAVLETDLLGPNMIGLTLGHGIYICHGHNSSRLLSHECRHVQQYEQAGSIAAFLPMYLQQIARFGYTNAPYEIDACAYEIDA